MLQPHGYPDRFAVRTQSESGLVDGSLGGLRILQQTGRDPRSAQDGTRWVLDRVLSLDSGRSGWGE